MIKTGKGNPVRKQKVVGHNVSSGTRMRDSVGSRIRIFWDESGTSRVRIGSIRSSCETTRECLWGCT